MFVKGLHSTNRDLNRRLPGRIGFENQVLRVGADFQRIERVHRQPAACDAKPLPDNRKADTNSDAVFMAIQ